MYNLTKYTYTGKTRSTKYIYSHIIQYHNRLLVGLFVIVERHDTQLTPGVIDR